ncbi:TIGR03618 family F420-dependent PPOX class oxidoreductase [Pseudonocardia sp. CA-107938]|uniref:TIGR03618 family F420-dependent PPOX class oxidoreductase n=1 Tax=Pseudonocardia sp. CA-107938 TaxID=3240021 RepID=UPI003D92894E
MLNADVRAAIDNKALAHLATVTPDGAPHAVPVFVTTLGERIAFFTGPHTRKARNLQQDPRVALSLASADNPFTPMVVRGRVVEWIDGDAGWALVDEIQIKYTGAPYPRGEERVVAIIEPERQTVGVG